MARAPHWSSPTPWPEPRPVKTAGPTARRREHRAADDARPHEQPEAVRGDLCNGPVAAADTHRNGTPPRCDAARLHAIDGRDRHAAARERPRHILERERRGP